MRKNGSRVKGEGPTYRERLKGRVSCRECGELMTAGYLTSHMMTQHGRVVETQWRCRSPAAGARLRTFRMKFPVKGGPQSCPVEGCSRRVATRTEMRVHLMHRHVLNTVVILEEGNVPHPWCARCDIMVP